jgi:hypothetical protein
MRHFFISLAAERMNMKNTKVLKGIKRGAAVIAVATVMSIMGSTVALKADRGNDNKGTSKDKPVAMPEAGSALVLLGLALVGVEGYRRWAGRMPKADE